MRGLYLAIVRNKDHLLFALALVFSSFLLLNSDDPRMHVIRGKAIETVAFISSPMTWVKSLMFLEEKNQLLREKNLALSLQVESELKINEILVVRHRASGQKEKEQIDESSPAPMKVVE